MKQRPPTTGLRQNWLPATKWVWSLIGVLLLGCQGTMPFDPVMQDPAFFDPEFPPRLAEQRFVIEGEVANGLVYVAQGKGPHPTAVLLHGFPGNEKNLDLAQAIRRAGWNVVFFHYRGSWGSGGTFSFAHVLEDVPAVVEILSEPKFAESHRVDAERIVLIGHSMGGFAALLSGARMDKIECLVSIAGGNLGALSKAVAESPEQVAAMANTLEGWSGPLRGVRGSDLVAEVRSNIDDYDLTSHANVLGQKNVLLIAGNRDQVTPVTLHHAPLVESIVATGGSTLQTEIFENADHSFSGQRIALARRVTDWLSRDCPGREARVESSLGGKD